MASLTCGVRSDRRVPVCRQRSLWRKPVDLQQSIVNKSRMGKKLLLES